MSTAALWGPRPKLVNLITYFSWNTIGVLVLLFHIDPTFVTGHPSPIMSRVQPDEPGVYSLFPNENLRTGKSLGPRHDVEPDRFRDRDRDHFTARHRPFEEYRVRPSHSQHYNRILFDDERLNYPSRPRPLDYRDDFPERPPVSLYSQEYPGRVIIPAFPEAKLPARLPPDEPRIHVFNPDSGTFGRPGFIEPKRNHNAELPPDDAEVQPGRILIPGHNSIMNLREPGPDSFLNHEEYLDYHTKVAVDELQVLEKKNRKTDARRLLFSSANIAGLVPPKTDEEERNDSGGEVSESPEPQIRLSHKDKGHLVTLPQEEEVKLEPAQEHKERRFQPKPTLENGFVPIRPFRVKGEEESPRLRGVKAGKLHLRPETNSSTIKPPALVTFSPPYSYPYVKKSSPVTRITKVTKSYSSEVPLLIPVTEPPFTEFVDTDELNPTRFRTEIPLIFLETQEKIVGGLPKGKKMVVVKRLKASVRESINGTSERNTTPSSSIIESTMRVVRNEVDSVENKDVLSSTEFNLQQSTGNGIVSKIHAHISTCPKLHGPAEIICDVHIRKRHGSPNPQLSVGWKRKFHNGTAPDLLLAVNKTLAYVEEDFHDKFNVTLAPGISPMLRSVLSIRHVSPTDTGNYQCEVSDGESKLKSDTLLFLCH